MKFLVLETRPEDNSYGDTPTSYTFPRRYLRFFEPLRSGEEVMAVLYEPRRGNGRQSYVAWTTLSTPPVVQAEGSDLYKVEYTQEIRPFNRPVPRLLEGRAFESEVRALPPVRHGSFLQGKSVREISADDFMEILSYAEVVPDLSLPHGGPLPTTDRTAQERTIHRWARDGSFRQRILRAYGYRCAVSGFGYKAFYRFGIGRLVEGAHIRPVAGQGSDDTSNGIALTPSLHGLFDAGLFTMEYVGTDIRLVVSRELSRYELGGAQSASRLSLVNGQSVALPEDDRARPDPDALEFHRARIFRP